MHRAVFHFGGFSCILLPFVFNDDLRTDLQATAIRRLQGKRVVTRLLYLQIAGGLQSRGVSGPMILPSFLTVL
jgi:hypothetical protein